MEFQVAKRVRSITIALPASIVVDIPHLREKTQRIGMIGRAAAIFRVDNILIYEDASHPQTQERALIQIILRYMVTPQYLRKALFPMTPELAYAGTLPPLRTPHHPLAKNSKELRIGDIRQGAVQSSEKNRSLVDIGVERPAVVHEQLPLRRVVNVKVTGINSDLAAEKIVFNNIPYYWGFHVEAPEISLPRIIDYAPYNLRVATSRRGESLGALADQLRLQWHSAQRILIVFGGPATGLYELASRNRMKLNEAFDFIINSIPNQGTETVRTEEAIASTLAVLSTLMGDNS